MAWVDPSKRSYWWRRIPPKERPMYCFVGRRGQGKTLLLTEMLINRMRQGERVYCNFGLTDWRCGLKAGYLGSLYDILDLEDATVAIDEANLWVSARDWQKIPAEVLSRWAQSRHHGLSLCFTSQHEDRLDKQLLQLIDWLVVCERLPFVPRRFPVFRTHFTFLEEIAEIRRGKLSKASLHWIAPDVFSAYDTHEVIEAGMLERMKSIRKAVQAGVEPEIPFTRIEPMVYDREFKMWVPHPGTPYPVEAVEGSDLMRRVQA